MIKKLKKLKKSKILVSIERKNIDDRTIRGFILKYSTELVLIQYVYDFHLDGLMVLRIFDITEIKSDKTDIFQTQLLKDERLYSKINFSKRYKIENWYSVLSTIGRKYDLIIIEDENIKCCPIFIIGKLHKITKESVFILGFSGVASWDDELSEIYYEDITSFQVDYANVYKRFFKKSNK